MEAHVWMAAVCLAVPGWAGVTNVTSGGPLYSSLTQAVAVAASGDELRVSTGAYFGNLVIAGKHLAIRGGYAPDFSTRGFEPEQTVISTSGVAPVIFIDVNAHVLLEAVRITGGGVFWLWGGGVFAGDNCIVTARYCRIDRNTSLFGGGVAAWSNAVFVAEGSWIDHNTAILEGGGIYGFLDARIALLDPCACFDNWAPRGGAVTLYGASLTTFGPCTFDGNIAAERGGALYLFNGAHAEIRPHATFGWTTPNLVTNGDGGCVYAAASSFIMRGDPATMTSINRSRATHDGGAIFVSNSVCTLADFVELAGPVATSTPCRFGGGICALDSMVTLSNNVRVHSCVAMAGGAIAAHRSTLTLVDAITLGDTNYWLMNGGGTAGGGIYAYACTTRLTRTHVVYNAAEQGGGGLCLCGTGLCAIVACVIEHNMAGEHLGGGGLAGLWAIGPCVVDNTLIASNTTMRTGGGIHWHGSGDMVVGNGTRIEDNVARYGSGGGVYLDVNGSVSLRTMAIARNRSGESGGGLYVQTGSVACTECVFSENRANVVPTNAAAAVTTGGGGVALMPGVAFTAMNCVWRNNSVSNNYGSGGALLAQGARVTVGSTFTNGSHGVLPPTLLVGNQAGLSNSGGGALALMDGSDGVIQHAVLASNRAMNGGGIAVQDADALLENLVIVQNRADGVGAGLVIVFPRNQPLVRQCTLADNDKYGCEIGGGTARFQNCIFSGNTVAQITPWSETAMVSYCDIEGGYAGAGNIDSNPVFVAAAALNYDIAADSPCRDSGMNLAAVTNDCIGTARPYGAGWDMGAYEFVPEPGGWGVLALVTIYRLQFRIRQKRREQ